jgi:hypothetical protein
MLGKCTSDFMLWLSGFSTHHSHLLCLQEALQTEDTMSLWNAILALGNAVHELVEA